MKKPSEFERGVRAAASLAAEYKTNHPYRLDDCILCKLNVTKRKNPRKNKQQLRDEDDVWYHGYAMALAEMYRWKESNVAILSAARAAGLTLKIAKKMCDHYDWRVLKKAGLK